MCVRMARRAPVGLATVFVVFTVVLTPWLVSGSWSLRAPLPKVGFCAHPLLRGTVRCNTKNALSVKRDKRLGRCREATIGEPHDCQTPGADASLFDHDAQYAKEDMELEKLEAWLDGIGVDRGGGARSERNSVSVRLGRFPGMGIGLECTRELERDSTVASIPRRVCLSSHPADAPAGTLRAWAHSLLGAVSPPPPTRDRNGGKPVTMEHDVMVVTLQLFLEHAAGSRSALSPWVAMIPLENDNLNLPALWPAGDRAVLRGTVVLRDTEECLARAVLERNWAAEAIAYGLEHAREGVDGSTVKKGGEADSVIRTWCSPGCKDMQGRPGLAEWVCVRSAVQSRAYRVGGRYVLIPLVDFANHDDKVAYAVSPGDGVFTGTDEVVLSADRAYRLGEQVWTSYGSMDNAKRLFSFGFVTLTLSTTPRRSPNAAERSTICEKSGADKRSSAKHASNSTCRPSTSIGGSTVYDEPLFVPTEAYCDIALPVRRDDPLCRLKTKALQVFSRKRGDYDIGYICAVFRLNRISHGPSFLQRFVHQHARPFLESALPLLRLVTLTPEDMMDSDMADICRVGKFSAKPSQVTGSYSVCSQSSVEPGCNFSNRPIADVNEHVPPEIVESHCVSEVESRVLPRTAERNEKISSQLLARLEHPISADNERRAVRLLQEQCSDHLKAIGLDFSDVDALVRVAREVDQGRGGGGDDGHEMAVTQPRRVLCAAVRVAETIGWGAMLHACGQGDGVCMDSGADCFDGHQTLEDWLQHLCEGTEVCG